MTIASSDSSPREIRQNEKHTDKASSERIETWYCRRISSKTDYIIRIFFKLKDRPENCGWGYIRSWIDEIDKSKEASDKGCRCVLRYISKHVGSRGEDSVLPGRYQCTVLYNANFTDLMPMREVLCSEEEYRNVRTALETALQ